MTAPCSSSAAVRARGRDRTRLKQQFVTAAYGAVVVAIALGSLLQVAAQAGLHCYPGNGTGCGAGVRDNGPFGDGDVGDSTA